MDPESLGRARTLKAEYDDYKFRDPARAGRAASDLAALARDTQNLEVNALAAWTSAMAALHLEGHADRAIPLIEQATTAFLALGAQEVAATAQLTRMHALGLLGRYQEAVACGEWARDVFLEHHDAVAAGKVEQNLGNLSLRRDDYAAAERLYRSARDRFLATQDDGLLARAENNLGYALLQRHAFREAAETFGRALAYAAAAGSGVTQAEIEDNLGCLGLVQGRYDEALDYLERARRRLLALGKPHEAAVAERELADAYLELNLVPEAAEIYARAVPAFASLGMRAEHAWALVHQARAFQALAQGEAAKACLREARALYEAEGNSVGEAMVTLAEAQVARGEGDFATAALAAKRAEAPLAAAGAIARLLTARWVRGDALRALGQRRKSAAVLRQTLHDAEQQAMPQVALRCYTSLGLIARAAGRDRKHRQAAEAAFSEAVALVEQLRAPLPAEQLRVAFLADHLLPFTELARHWLEQSNPRRALDYVERARSRALLDMVDGALPAQPPAGDDFQTELIDQLTRLREELNWLYTQIERPPTSGPNRTAAELEAQVREREAAVLELSRRLQLRGGPQTQRVGGLDLDALQAELGEHTAVVEYFSLDGELLAFVVTGGDVEVIRGLGAEDQVMASVEQFRFQIDALRVGIDRMRPHLPQLVPRARHHLSWLYDRLLRPIEERLGARRLVVVPHRGLHYVPFHALYDGSTYVVERHEVAYAPSAGVLQQCLKGGPTGAVEHALLVGVPDETTPRVLDEVTALAALFTEPRVLLCEDALLSSLREAAPSADVLHLACHGQFRPDNPLFSSLRLADGRLTVRDAAALDLRHCALVALSACETGVSAIAPGDELIGLARGFLSAGTPSLLVSLWPVDDETTAQLMVACYERLRAGDRPAAALRYAQRSMLERHPHPFFWSPFSVVGRW